MKEYLLTNYQEVNEINNHLREFGLLTSSQNFFNNESLFNFYEQFLLGTLTVLPRIQADKVGSYAFQNLSQLTKINLASCGTNIEDGAFENCINLSQITFATGGTRFYNKTFAGCINLYSVHIPFPTFIGEYAFSGCYNLFSIYITGTSANNAGTLNNINNFKDTPFDIEYVTNNNISFGTIYVPQILINQYQQATNWTQLYAYNSQVFQPLPT